MIDTSISVHLQDFPNLSFIDDNQELVSNMDFVRAICSTVLSIRDNKNLRVRLPLNCLTIIGKNANRALEFKDIIADEVNVKNIEIKADFQDLAELKLQINFKKIGVKFGSKVKEIMAAANKGEWQKIADNKIQISGVFLIDDDFELKLIAKNNDDKNQAIAPLASNDCLVCLDINITQELLEEGISRDIIRAIQQTRKDADLDISDRIKIAIFSENKMILQAAEKFADFIKDQVLASQISLAKSVAEVKAFADFSCESKIDDGNLLIALKK